MKKIWGWVLAVVILVALGIYIYFNNSNSAPASTPAVGTNNTTPTSTTSTGAYQDGAYTGSLADAVYGKLQLAVTISGGEITNVTWPVYPNTAGHTIQVNQTALPQLEQEAIASQNANVNIVSGATQTSEAFQQSLAAALVQAKI